MAVLKMVRRALGVTTIIGSALWGGGVLAQSEDGDLFLFASSERDMNTPLNVVCVTSERVRTVLDADPEWVRDIPIEERPASSLILDRLIITGTPLVAGPDCLDQVLAYIVRNYPHRPLPGIRKLAGEGGDVPEWPVAEPVSNHFLIVPGSAPLQPGAVASRCLAPADAVAILEASSAVPDGFWLATEFMAVDAVDQMPFYGDPILVTDTCLDAVVALATDRFPDLELEIVPVD